MEEKPNYEQEKFSEEEPASSKPSAWPWAAALVLACAVVIALVMFFREQDSRRQLQSANAQMTSDLSQMHDQVSDLNSKINALSAAQSAQAAQAQPGVNGAAQASGSQTAQTPTVRHTGKKRAKDDPRWKQMQDQLAENKEQIDATNQKVDSAKEELEGNLNSTRDDLNGSIAKSHDELVALEKKGERAYFEFSLSKAKGFDRVGPVSLSLRKTNEKNGFYDMAVIVEDSRLNKKHINLFEPVLFYPSDSHQPLELVVNRIGKDKVQGYVSAPKYKEAQSAAAAAPSDQTAPDAKTALPHRTPDEQ
ncbi:MAG TPA: hypothetical protein VKV95_07005 [Terriglobia bacterium]|nr:hypothetical protein [Terriglobia bacterium]